MSKARDPMIKRATEAVGGVGRLASIVGITPQGIARWRRIPPHHVLAVEAATGIRREVLRPDIYGAPRPRKRQPSHAAA